jgi:hypothetical protein
VEERSHFGGVEATHLSIPHVKLVPSQPEKCTCWYQSDRSPERNPGKMGRHLSRRLKSDAPNLKELTIDKLTCLTVRFFVKGRNSIVLRMSFRDLYSICLHIRMILDFYFCLLFFASVKRRSSLIKEGVLCGWYSVAFLIRKPLFNWCVVRWGSKN